MGEIMENKSYFGKVCLCKLILVSTSVFNDKNPSSLPGFWLWARRGSIFFKGKFMPCFWEIKGGRELFLHLLILSCCQHKIMLMPKWPVSEWYMIDFSFKQCEWDLVVCKFVICHFWQLIKWAVICRFWQLITWRASSFKEPSLCDSQWVIALLSPAEALRVLLSPSPCWPRHWNQHSEALTWDSISWTSDLK